MTIVTTSWDDGHSADLRVAALLAANGLKGTFYVAFNHPSTPQISDAEIRSLHAMGMEIGSHTLTHKILTGRPFAEAHHELAESKKRLEDIVGAPVAGLSYPQGAYTAAARKALAATGYIYGRTTVAFRLGRTFDPELMPISYEFWHMPRIAISRHALRDGNILGLCNWLRVTRLGTDPVALGRMLFDAAHARGGIFHLNARSWEIDQRNLWGELETVLHHVANRPDVRYMTNGEAIPPYN